MKKSSRLLLITSVIIALFGSGLIFAQIFRAKRAAVSELGESLETYLRVTEEALNAVLLRVNSSLMDIHLDLKENKWNFNAATRHLYNHRSILSDIEGLELRVTDADGKVIAATKSPMDTDELIGQDFSQRPYFKYLKEHPDFNDLYVDDPFYGKLRGKWVLILSRRWAKADGSFAGVVIASIDADYFERFYERIGVKKFTLFNLAAGPHNKRLMRYPINKASIGEPLPFQGLLSGVRDWKLHNLTTNVHSPVDGANRLVSMSRVGKFQMIVVLGQDFDTYLAHWRREAGIYIFAVIVLNLVGIYIIFKYLKYAKALAEKQMQLASTAKMVALGEMSASIAHEINNPLAIILGNSRKLRRLMSEPDFDREKYLYAIGKIDVTIERISKIILGLKKFARESEVDTSPVTLQAIMNETFGISMERFRSKGVELTMNLHDPAVMVMVNEVQMTQVLINLLNNSFDAVCELPEKWVRIESVQIGKLIQLSVIDSGKGLSKGLADRVMEPFFTTKELGKGTGLGLSISKGIIEAHRGRLFYDPKSLNTKFTIELPVISENAQPLKIPA